MNKFKTFSLLILFSLLFGFPAFSEYGSFISDVPADSKYAEAIHVVSVLKIMNVYDDGRFLPENNMTRAEFLVSMLRCMGINDVEASALPTYFDDVSPDDWFFKYVMLAKEVGVIDGCGNNSFIPNSYITYEHALVILVRMIGYRPKAESLGGFPDGYMQVAREEGMTRHIDKKLTDELTREDVATFFYNTLMVPLMEMEPIKEAPVAPSEIVTADMDSNITLEERLSDYVSSLGDIYEFDYQKSILQDNLLITSSFDKLDFNGDEKNDELRLSLIDELPNDELQNNPINLKLEISDSSVNFISEWNDGVYLYITDFDSEDNFLDIYICSTGTGVGTLHSEIYRYDGEKLYKYLEFDHYTSIRIDSAGKIYYYCHALTENGEFGELVLSRMDYNTKAIDTLE